MMRIRTKRHELIITPGKLVFAAEEPLNHADQVDEKYILVVLQDPSQ